KERRTLRSRQRCTSLPAPSRCTCPRSCGPLKRATAWKQPSSPFAPDEPRSSRDDDDQASSCRSFGTPATRPSMVSSGRRQAPRRGDRNLPRHHCSRVAADPARAEKVPASICGGACSHSQKTKSAAGPHATAHIEAKFPPSVFVREVATSEKLVRVSSLISRRIDSAATFSNGDLPIHVASNAV